VVKGGPREPWAWTAATTPRQRGPPLESFPIAVRIRRGYFAKPTFLWKLRRWPWGRPVTSSQKDREPGQNLRRRGDKLAEERQKYGRLPGLVQAYERANMAVSKLALKVLRGDSASSAGDEVHGVEPQVQGRGRLVEDRPGRWMDVMTTAKTRPRLTPLRCGVSLERAVLVALRTMGRFPVNEWRVRQRYSRQASSSGSGQRKGRQLSGM
jgi:hypothetical protein